MERTTLSVMPRACPTRSAPNAAVCLSAANGSHVSGAAAGADADRGGASGAQARPTATAATHGEAQALLGRCRRIAASVGARCASQLYVSLAA